MTPQEMATRFDEAQRKKPAFRIPEGATCSECDKPYYADGLCSRHYDRRRYLRKGEERRAEAKRHLATLTALAQMYEESAAHGQQAMRPEYAKRAAAIRWALDLTAFPVDAETTR